MSSIFQIQEILEEIRAAGSACWGLLEGAWEALILPLN